MLLMLVSVAFYIVTERKGLGMLQLRQGPNKVRLKGFLQPLGDGVKLFTKELAVPFPSPKNMYLLGPFICFFCAYSLWMLFPRSFSFVNFENGLLFFLCVSAFRVYGVFLTGWICDSRYGFLGAIRAVAQRISYEIFIRTCLFCPLVLVGRYDLVELRDFSFFSALIGLEVFLMWLICVLAETNRAPFDFVEGESELVAGYAVEFGGFNFALLALAEYRNMLFIRILSVLLFFGPCPGGVGDIVLGGLVVLASYCIVWVRGTLPRYKYDLLMRLCWKILLPMSLCCLCFRIVFLL